MNPRQKYEKKLKYPHNLPFFLYLCCMFAATIGFFDGVHRGHRCLIDQLKELAQVRSLDTLVLTMDRHPRQVLQSDYIPQLLTTLEEKCRLLRETGISRLDVLTFDSDMARLSAEEFMREVLKPRSVSLLMMGYDHRFGHGEAVFEDYVRWGEACGIEVVKAHELPDVHVSSTTVRRLLAEGNIREAQGLLGHPYLLSGTVVEGHRLGHTIGFPTANLAITPGKVLPREGAYAVRTPYGVGMMDIGTRPTANNGNDLSVEVHLIDFSGDLYGQTLSLELIGFLREERAFPSLEALRAQLEQDREAALHMAEHGC